MMPYTSGVAAPAAAPPVPSPGQKRAPITDLAASLRPVWSKPAAYRALRTTLVMPSLFAFSIEVIGNAQMATFASFGAFATLLLATFGGTRRDKLVAHTGLALTGTVMIVIGTAVSFNTAVAALVTVPVAFSVLFAGIVGPNAASGSTAALLPYILPATTAGNLSVVPDRLAGWWLASVVGTAAVLVLAPKPPGDRLRTAAASSAAALADQIDAALTNRCSQAIVEAAMAAKHSLIAAFDSAPYRPTGIAVPDQALAQLVESLEWCATVVSEAAQEGTDLSIVREVDQQLFREAAGVLRGTARLLEGNDVPAFGDDLDELVHSSETAAVDMLMDGKNDTEEIANASFHARLISSAARTAATDALIFTQRGAPAVVAAEVTRWQGEADLAEARVKRPVLFDSARRVVSGQASLRSVWFLNSIRGAVALAVAVAVADLTNVQHAFWVVLGTLSVLRTNAASTGATAVRALGGTAIGFFIGAALILAVGSHTDSALGGPAYSCPGGLLCPRDDAIRGRPGVLHRHDQHPVQHPGPGRVESRSRQDRGRRHWRCRERHSGHLLLAERGVQDRRRRPGGRISPRWHPACPGDCVGTGAAHRSA